MVMDIMGTPVDLPLYDLQGNQLTPGEDIGVSRDAEINQQAQLAWSKVKEELDSLNQIGSRLSLCEDIEIYDTDNEEYSDLYFSVQIHGGLNGCGLWSNYFSALSDLTLRLESVFQDVWIMSADIDCPDDVFYITVGIRDYN